MLEREFEILQAFNDVEYVAADRIHVAFTGKHDVSHIIDLAERGLLKNDGTCIRLTQDGYKAYQAEREKRDKAACEKQAALVQKRNDSRKAFVRQLLSFILTYKGEGVKLADKLLEKISSLFH